MNLTDDIHYYADPDAIVIWWEKPEEAELIDEYELRLDGSVAGVTEKTHFTFGCLESGTEYSVQVSAKNAEGLLLDDVALRIKTPQRKKCIVVTDAPYNAVGDSVTKNTLAIQRAIDDCPEGGTVIVPEGTFLTGALRLHSNMEFFISEGAMLLGSVDPEDYLPMIRGRVNGMERQCFAGILNIGRMDHSEGSRCRNIIIHGSGTVKGGGSALAASEAQAGSYSEGLINISNSMDVRVSGITLTDAPMCDIHITYSLNEVIDHCVFRSGDINAGDGLISDSSENCTIFSCVFFTEGDSVSVKSGINAEGMKIGRPSRKIRIFDCKSMFGTGICIGSEISGGIENIKIWDCDLERTSSGIQIIGAKKGAGYVRGLWVMDCVTSRLRAMPVDVDDAKGTREGPPDFGNFIYERIKVTGRSLKNGNWRDCRSVEMDGFGRDHPIRNVMLRNVEISGGLGVHTEFCENLYFEGDDN